MFVVLIGSVLTTFAARPRRSPGAAATRLHSPARALALVHRPLRQLRRGDGGGARQGAGRRAAQDAQRDARQAARGAGRRRESRACLDRPADGRPRAGRPGDVIPGDGEVVDGVASVDESAVTGESAPVIRESGGDRSAVTGGTKVLSDQLVVRITAEPGQTFLDRMIALVEGAARQKTPNEIALTILLSGLTIVFLLAIATLQPLAIYVAAASPCPFSSRCWCASSRPPSAGSSRPSASRAWTASSSTTSSR